MPSALPDRCDPAAGAASTAAAAAAPAFPPGQGFDDAPALRETRYLWRWLDRSFDEVVERGWRAVQVRISETGKFVDVCSGTGAGRNASPEYYLTRPAVTGPDDRGGAMALTAALEMHALRAPR